MGDDFKDRLRRWRGLLRQKEAAAILDVPLPTLRKWEKGKRTPQKLALIELERRMAERGTGQCQGGQHEPYPVNRIHDIQLYRCRKCSAWKSALDDKWQTE